MARVTKNLPALTHWDTWGGGTDAHPDVNSYSLSLDLPSGAYKYTITPASHHRNPLWLVRAENQAGIGPGLHQTIGTAHNRRDAIKLARDWHRETVWAFYQDPDYKTTKTMPLKVHTRNPRKRARAHPVGAAKANPVRRRAVRKALKHPPNKAVNELTESEALAWLMRNDPDSADYWKGVSMQGEIAPDFFRVTAQNFNTLASVTGAKTNPRARGDIDRVAASELIVAIQNDDQHQRRQIDPIILNLARKMKRGSYDRKKATKLWLYAADEGAKRYNKVYGDGTMSLKLFNKPTREYVATQLFEKYHGNVIDMYNELTAKRNPAMRKKKATRKKATRKKATRKNPARRVVNKPRKRFTIAAARGKKSGWWTGAGFDTDPQKAKLYGSMNVAARDARKMRKNRALKGYTLIVAPVINSPK